MLEPHLKNSLTKILEKYLVYQKQLVQESTIKDIKLYTLTTRKMAKIAKIAETFQKYLRLEKNVADARLLIQSEKNNELVELAKSEVHEGEVGMAKTVEQLRALLLPPHPMDSRNVIVEIRGAAGGDEGNIFAADLFKMYDRWAKKQGMKVEVLETQYTSTGSTSLIVFRVTGTKPYSKFRFETGAHRVQRVPSTEGAGRTHTSTAVVTVLPETEKAGEIVVRPQDIRIDVFHSSGAGGQSVNTTDSAVRITHLATKIVVTSQDERSQVQNKSKAMTILRAKLYQLELDKQEAEQKSHRELAGRGSRSEKIRTYNFAQNRVTDHRINFSTNSLDRVLLGELDPLFNALLADERARREAKPQKGFEF